MPRTIETDNSPADSLGKVIFADDGARVILAKRLGLLSRPDKDHWRQVKHNASRTVYRGVVDGAKIFLKHFHSRSLLHRLTRAVGLSDARSEMRFMLYLRSHGVPTAQPLATMCDKSVEWLATRAVTPSEQADQWHIRQLSRGRAGRQAIQQAIVVLAKTIGRMHAVGVIHQDLHCGNILIRTDSDAVDLAVSDLHRARRRRRLSRRAMAANLAQLYYDRFQFTTRSERLRFLKHYLRASGAAGTLRGWQFMIEHFAHLHKHRQYAQRNRRVTGNNQYFHSIKLPGGWRGHVVLASKRWMAGSLAAKLVFDTEAWRSVLAKPAALLQGGDAEIIKDSGSGLIVRRRLTVGRNEVEVFIKRPRRKHLWKVLVDCLRPARPIRAFKLGHMLLTRRIATSLPLASLERRCGPFLLDSILITEAVHATPLNKFLNTWLARPPRGDTPLTVPQQRRLGQQVLWQLGKLLQRLHDNHFAHRDLKAANLLISWSPGASPEVVLLDLDGLRCKRRITMRNRFQGLMRLNVSLLESNVVNHAGRLRMLLGYLRRPGSGRIHFKPYWRLLERWSARKLRDQIRSRRRRQKAVRRPG
ncbi:MAG: lipopolysaccharide kinase InaA family protein [Planctomycetota bacterium]|nr:lipopolysaccharide kinase InaA family protein [Planctomycetota bacterium]